MHVTFTKGLWHIFNVDEVPLLVLSTVLGSHVDVPIFSIRVTLNLHNLAMGVCDIAIFVFEQLEPSSIDSGHSKIASADRHGVVVPLV
jgi:hypothetical protein